MFNPNSYLHPTMSSLFRFIFFKKPSGLFFTFLLSLFRFTMLFSQHAHDAAIKDQMLSVSFTENKGQVTDQNNLPRTDVLFGGSSKGMAFHLRKDGISYQLGRVDSYKTKKNPETGKSEESIDTYTTYRLDVNWLNTNPLFTCKTEGRTSGCANYFLETHPDGIYNVNTFKSVIYKNIYQNIDLHYYEKNGDLKYDFIVAPHAHYKKIRMEISGSEKIELQSDGSLLITTPLGTIQEGAPIVLQKGKQLKARWLIQHNTLSFDIENYDRSVELIIDPATRVWGTYYGANNDQHGLASTTDLNGDVYMAGYQNNGTTYTTMATSGAHQTTSSGGSEEAFIVKFNSTGARLWATYYGGTGSERFSDCKTDAAGNLFLVGWTTSSVSIATSSAQQSVYGGSFDAFLVKFNSSGVRQWSTYFGGTGTEYGDACAIDPSGNIYITGVTYSNTGTPIVTVGAHQTVYGGMGDAFLAKYNTSGVLQWSTYYGDSGGDRGLDCETDAAGNVYVAGETESVMNIAAGTVHQNIHGGGTDGFLAKFNGIGQRLLATYYGGSGQDVSYSCSLDPNGNIYICGATSTSVGTSIATASSHQPIFGSAITNGFLAKFDNLFARQWGTYYGGSVGNFDEALDCTNDGFGNLYVIGSTYVSSGTVIATSGSHQTTSGGGSDSYLAKFDAATGARAWGTYYGGGGSDRAYSVVAENNGNIYVSGGTAGNYGTAIATLGAYQTTNTIGGGYDAFLVKFFECAAAPIVPVSSTPGSNLLLCGNTSASLSASGLGTISWYSSSTSTTSLGTGSTFITPTLSAGIYTYYVAATTCTTSASRLPITVTVSTLPSISVNSGSICTGQSFTLAPTGASSYTFEGGTNVVTPSVNTTYTIQGSNSSGCLSANIATASVLVFMTPTVSVNSGTVCAGSVFTLLPSGANTYSYSGGSALVSPLTNTLYSVVGISSAGCVSSNTAIASVTVLSSPSISVNSGTICSGQSFTIIAYGAITYTYASGNSSVVVPSSSATFSVAGTNSLGCISSPVLSSVSVNPNPTITATSGSICAGNVFTINPSGAATYTFSSGTATVSPSSNTFYTITGTSPAGCISSAPTTITVSVAPLPTISVSGGTVCYGQSFTLQPTGASTYSYSSGSAMVSPLTNSVYFVSGTSSLGCISSGSTAVSITVVASPTITVNSGTICSGQVFTIVPSGAQSYTYQGGSASVSPLVSTTFSVAGTNSLGCVSNTVGSSVMVSASPTISVPGGTLCSGNIFTLSPSGASSYSYSSLTATVQPGSTNTYTVVGSSSAGCLSNTVVTTVSVIPLPTISVSNGSVCPGGIFTITPIGAFSYVYSTGSATLAPVNTSTFSVTGISVEGCNSSNTATASVGIYNLPSVTINGPVISCAGVSQTLQASGAATYTWNSAATSATLLISPTSTSTYSIVGKDANGCINTAFKTVSVNPLPTLSVSGTGTICQGLSASLLVSGTALTYTWSTGASGNLITVSPLISTAYTVTGTDINNCSNSAIQVVLVNTLPPVTANASNTNICSGSQAVLYGSGASSYTWTGGVTNNLPFYPNVTSSYTVTGTGSNSCKNTATIQLIVNPLPSLSLLSSSSQTICNGDVVMLTANGANIYNWSTGDITNTISVAPTSNSNYSLTGTDANGCSATAMYSMVVNECTGLLKTNRENSISIYPNPAVGAFYIQVTGYSDNLTVEIYNVLGELVHKAPLSHTLSQTNMSTYANGIYMVMVFNGLTLVKEEKLVKTQ